MKKVAVLKVAKPLGGCGVPKLGFGVQDHIPNQ